MRSARVVEDADPYDEAFPVGRDAHIAPGFGRRPERGAEVVDPYAGCGVNSPGVGSQVGTFCRVVEGADPYDEAFPVGRDAHIAPGFGRRPERGAEVVAPYAECGADSPGGGSQVGAFCAGRRGRRPLRL